MVIAFLMGLTGTGNAVLIAASPSNDVVNHGLIGDRITGGQYVAEGLTDIAQSLIAARGAFLLD